MKNRRNNRSGAVAVLLCFLLLPLLALLALSVDYGFLLYVRTDLQRVADQAALASVRELVPNANGSQDISKVREVVREYVKLNMGNDFVVKDSDIEIGRFNPKTIYTSVDMLTTGPFDTVRVAIRRDDVANNSVALFFARLFGNDESDVSAASTAVLQKARYLAPGSPVFPFAIEKQAWNEIEQGESVSIYGDGRIEDSSGNPIPGNFGTVDVGPSSNGTSMLGEQILNGLSQNDLDSLHKQGKIPTAEYIDGRQNPLDLNGDPGLSSGLQHAVGDVEGTTKLIPIYNNTTSNSGNNLEFEIVGWSSVEVVDSKFSGRNNTFLEVKKSFMYDGSLLPGNSLSDTTWGIEGAFTSPVLVQ